MTTKIVEKEFENVRLIKLKKNLGFGKANNIGLKIALEEDAEYVFLLNQDAYIKKNTIEKLIKIQNKYPKFGILSPFHLDYSGENIEFYFSTIINPFDCPGFINDMYLKNYKDVYEINFVHAACWLISKECLQTVGGFDPLFNHYGEDNDYVNRAYFHNFKIGVVSDTFVFHKGTNKSFDENDLNINYSRILLHYKQINHKLFGLIITNFKFFFDNITSSILYRQFRKMFILNRLFFRFLFLLPSIIKHRKISKGQKAFL
jgi:GT2 family glycosyltransferase